MARTGFVLKAYQCKWIAIAHEINILMTEAVHRFVFSAELCDPMPAGGVPSNGEDIMCVDSKMIEADLPVALEAGS